MNLESFINNAKPHKFPMVPEDSPPHDPVKRHEWESKILYSVINSLSDNNSLLDYGCGYGSMKFSLKNRYPNMEYIGLDKYVNKFAFPFVGDLSLLDEALERVDCIVAGSVFTHLSWGSIENILDKFERFFERGGEFGFTIFLTDKYDMELDNQFAKIEGYSSDVIEQTIEQYESYCKKNNLKFSLLPYKFKTDYYGRYQHFCNIRREI